MSQKPVHHQWNLSDWIFVGDEKSHWIFVNIENNSLESPLRL